MYKYIRTYVFVHYKCVLTVYIVTGHAHLFVHKYRIRFVYTCAHIYAYVSVYVCVWGEALRTYNLGTLGKMQVQSQTSATRGHFKNPQGDLPGGPVVKTPRFHCWGRAFHPWSGNRTPCSGAIVKTLGNLPRPLCYHSIFTQRQTHTGCPLTPPLLLLLWTAGSCALRLLKGPSLPGGGGESSWRETRTPPPDSSTGRVEPLDGHQGPSGVWFWGSLGSSSPRGESNPTFPLSLLLS